MLGNDIVDLADPETSWGGQHPRFDQRVFTSCERAALLRSPDPQRTRWVLWAVKESAFKGARRARPMGQVQPVESQLGASARVGVLLGARGPNSRRGWQPLFRTSATTGRSGNR